MFSNALCSLYKVLCTNLGLMYHLPSELPPPVSPRLATGRPLGMGLHTDFDGMSYSALVLPSVMVWWWVDGGGSSMMVVVGWGSGGGCWMVVLGWWFLGSASSYLGRSPAS